MTLEEAKKILEKEGFSLEGPGRKSCAVSEAFMKYESPEVCEAMQVVCTAGYMIKMFGSAFNARKERLKKEYEKNTKAPGSAENRIKEDSGVTPALKEAASQFNDALLDEQAKKIEKLAKKNVRLGEEIARLNKAIYKKNMKIEELRKESSRHLRGKIKMFYENIDLEGKLKDKDAVLADVAEELRLSKIREKNLTELCQKYIKAKEELKKKLADKVVDKIDAQALKSAESALAWKEKVIAEKDMALAYNKKEIADLDEKLADAKKELEGANNLVEIVRKGSREYCEYGIAAEKMIQKLAKIIVSKGLVPTEDFERCRLWAKGYRFNPQLPDFSEEEEKKLNTAKSTLDDLKENAYERFNAKAHNLGCVGSKNGNGISDQMVGADIAEEGGDHSDAMVLRDKDHVTKNEEIEIEKALILVRKAMKEGHTVTIDYKD